MCIYLYDLCFIAFHGHDVLYCVYLRSHLCIRCLFVIVVHVIAVFGC